LIRDEIQFTEENASDANDVYLHLERKRRSFPRVRPAPLLRNGRNARVCRR
jgi:hypothetical protein